MSSGDFNIYSYEASYDNDQIHPIRLQPETLAAEFNATATPGEGVTNIAPTGAVNNPISALASLGRKQAGLRARFVIGRWNSTPPAGYSGNTFKIIVPDRSNFDGVAVGQPVRYLGTLGTIVSKEPERAR